jgi:hypothetical protein
VLALLISAPDAVAAALHLVRAEEAWEPVIFGGMIPIAGALAIFWLIRYAIKEPPGDDPPADEPPPPAGESGDGHEGPLH